MFALLAFGAMFGFVGLLVAVPAASMIGVLVRFALTRYLQSDIYFGHSATLPGIKAGRAAKALEEPSTKE